MSENEMGKEKRDVLFMAISLIQEGMGVLTDETRQELSRFQQEGRDWQAYVIEKINGYPLPREIILAALRKRWLTHASKDREAFTRETLAEWGLLEEV